VSPVSTVPPDFTTYFQVVAPHATSELRLHEKIIATLRGLRYEEVASRKSTAVTLRGIQAQLVSLAMVVKSVRPPGRLAAAHDERTKAIHEMGSAAGELANALDGEAAAKTKRIEAARQRAEAAEVSSRNSANAISAGIGVAAAAVATIPVVGQIIAALLAAIAAIVILIGQILAKAKEQEAAEKEKGSKGEPKRKDDDWP
jgi:hypothetical protein